MVLKLDSRFPLLWRTPQSLQFGLDRPSAVLDAVSEADERVISALRYGISRSGAEMIGQTAGLDDLAIHALLAVLEPALEPVREPALEHERVDRPHSPIGKVTVSGHGETAGLVAEILRRSGAIVWVDDPTDEPTDPDIAVIVAHYVVEPELHGRWLRRDIPHLPIVFGDRVVRVGPLVRPGLGPCLYCLERQRSDADPAWPAISAQLWGRSSPVETALVASEVAALACRFVLDARRTGVQDAEIRSISIDLDTATGDTAARAWSPHPDCDCIAMDAELAGGSAVSATAGLRHARDIGSSERGSLPTRSAPDDGCDDTGNR